MIRLWVGFVTASLAILLATWRIEPSRLVDADKKLGEVPFAAERIYEPIIRLYDESNRFFCSGFVVDAHYAVTAAHCVRVANLIHIYDSEVKDTKVVATPAGAHDRIDYGLIKGDFSKFKSLGVNFTELELDGNKRYYACGYPANQKKMFCPPLIPAATYYFSVKAYGYLLPGQSGGPVIDPVTGRAVAVNSAVHDGYVIVVPLTGLSAAFGIEP